MVKKSLLLVFFLAGLCILNSCGGNGTGAPAGCVNASATIVCTQSGQAQGVVEGNLRAFRGIPYAAPPVGNLRWRPPAPPLTWQGIRDASTFGNACIQTDRNNQPVGSEDCLVLNVFAAASPPSSKQPVMVFIHGGGNCCGDSHWATLDAPPLATHGVVVVTAEYRLGALGFFAHPLLTAEGGGSSGNYALMDMIEALKWVRNNIANFGGDPNRVMLFGQSAGSYDIHPLLVSPAAQGLFSAAGMESNVIPHGQTLTLATAEMLNAPFVPQVGCDTAADVLACLRALPAATIVNNQGGPVLPIIEPPFLPMDPFDALQQRGSPVPLLIGSTREEWTGVSDNPNTPLDANGYAAAIHLEFDSFGAGVADQVLMRYPRSDYDSFRYALIAVDTDFNMTCEVRDLARVAAGAQRPPVWRYLYTHRFENDSRLNASRAFHTAELFFVFGNFQSIAPAFLAAINYTPSPTELTFSSQLMDYWTRFAATGDPNRAGATPWLRYEAASENILELDDMPAPTTINGYHNTQCDYLSTLQPQP